MASPRPFRFLNDLRASNPESTPKQCGRSSLGPPARSKFRAVLISPIWEKACGKLPKNRRVDGSYCSEGSPTPFRTARTRSKISRASSMRPCSARLSASHRVHSRKAPSLPGRPSTSCLTLYLVTNPSFTNRCCMACTVPIILGSVAGKNPTSGIISRLASTSLPP